MNKKILLGVLALALIACGSKFLNAAMKDYGSKASISSSVKPPSSWDDGLKTLPRTDKITRTPLRNEEDVKKVFTPPSTRDSEKSTRDIQASSRQTSEQTREKAEREASPASRTRTERVAEEKISGTREKAEKLASPLPEARTRTEREAQEKIAGTREKIEGRSKVISGETKDYMRESSEQKVDKKSTDKRKVAAVGGAAAAAAGAALIGGIAVVGGAALISSSGSDSSISTKDIPDEKPAEDIGTLEQGSGVSQSFGAETFEAVN